MHIQIRKAQPADYSAVLGLIHEFADFQKTPEKVTVTEDQMQKGQDLFQCFVAETKEKEIIGFASFFFAWYSWSGKNLYLDDLYVKPPYRQQKTGLKLFTRVMSYAIENNCIKMRWQVSKWNEHAISFYKGMGAGIDEVEINCTLDLKRELPSV